MEGIVISHTQISVGGRWPWYVKFLLNLYDSQPISRLTDTMTQYQTLLIVSKSKTYDARLACVGQRPSLQLAALLLLALRLALRLLFQLLQPY
jgi:hypothetical protein